MIEGRARIWDSLLELKSAAAVTADTVGLVGAVTTILDMGAGFYSADLILDISAALGGNSDENYTLLAQGSNSATFASGIANLAMFCIGVASTLKGGADAPVVAAVASEQRFVVPFNNQVGTTKYRYLRMYTDVTGTTPSITYAAFVSKRQ